MIEKDASLAVRVAAIDLLAGMPDEVVLELLVERAQEGGAPTLLAWCDLGHWVTAQGSLGLAYGAASRGTEFSWSAVLAKSFPMRALLGSQDAHDGHGDHDGHEHGVGGVVSLLLEARGSTVLSGLDEGAASRELLLGVSLPFASGLDLRAGWTVLWEGDEPASSGWIAGVVLEL